MQIEVWDEAGAALRRGLPRDEDFGAFVRSERLPTLLDGVTSHGGIVLAAVDGAGLRGYAALVPSRALEPGRWKDMPDLFELGSLEVARSERGRGIGSELLEAIAGELPLDSLLMFARGFVSHWDIGGAGLEPATPVQRRRQLLRMLGKIGFHRWDTTDPEVNDHPMNFLAVRAGANAPSSSVLALAESAYG